MVSQKSRSWNKLWYLLYFYFRRHFCIARVYCFGLKCNDNPLLMSVIITFCIYELWNTLVQILVKLKRLVFLSSLCISSGIFFFCLAIILMNHWAQFIRCSLLGGNISVLCNITLLLHVAQISEVVNNRLLWTALYKFKILPFCSVSVHDCVSSFI